MTRRLRLIRVPWDTARCNERMGRGPGRILEGGAVQRLERLGFDVEVARVDPGPAFAAEVSTAFRLMAGVAEEVRDAIANDRFPLVLAGNCNTTVGTVSGLAPSRPGVVWFDGHADLATPETTTSGFVDGMGLAILTGHCWRAMAARVPEFSAVPGEHVVLAGSSDIEESEMSLLRQAGITYVSDNVLNGPNGERALGGALLRVAGCVDGIHLHIDLDVHDARHARANHFRPPGGLAPKRLRQMIELVVRNAPVLSTAITAYDPDVDPSGVTLDSCLNLMTVIATGTPASVP